MGVGKGQNVEIGAYLHCRYIKIQSPNSYGWNPTSNERDY